MQEFDLIVIGGAGRLSLRGARGKGGAADRR